jgi:hypothetical protein
MICYIRIANTTEAMITIFAAVEQSLIDNTVDDVLRKELYTTRKVASKVIANWANKETSRGFTWNWNFELARWERWIGDALHVMMIEEYVVRDEEEKDPLEWIYGQQQTFPLGEFIYQPPPSDCMHDNCPTCKGTGYNAYGGRCVHGIACPCAKCRITC